MKGLKMENQVSEIDAATAGRPIVSVVMPCLNE